MSIVGTNHSHEFHLLHNRVIARGDVVFNSVLRLQWTLELRVDTVVRFIVGKQPSVRSPSGSSESHGLRQVLILTDPLVLRLPYAASIIEAFQFLPAWATKG
jgi:hypothetical protein